MADSRRRHSLHPLSPTLPKMADSRRRHSLHPLGPTLPKMADYQPLVEPKEGGANGAGGGSEAESPDVRGAKAIQHIFKRHRLVFGKLGPSIFCKKGGNEADYGELYFPASNSTTPFITVADTTSTNLLGNFMEKHWKIPLPEVLISVTGGAQDFVLSPQLQRVFDRGLVSAATSTNAWIVTGGTDTGVMKIVASAFNEQGVTVPLIGITPYGCVKGRVAFDNTRGTTPCTYLCTEKAAADGAPLNPHHTHWVFCDNGKVAPQG